jgi:hypothetical protein
VEATAAAGAAAAAVTEPPQPASFLNKTSHWRASVKRKQLLKMKRR